ncbi:LAGLIDADG family homing endonuclease [Archaeoglobus profundus]|uniref:DNA helicase n=1 Tax=Archaeoglobus profundus (strain DSM 5631 / JCM 9629 / NBRC 100127 / Av18) TaxID=572546 RepID=D2RHT0_ARCPA|nr:LAGLIDADG family homing endonuclease [Archaeoglobus profundus]ADB57855.1 MCM family protein [Archaeoglobus profundus DSM 5631]
MIDVWREFIENYCEDKIKELVAKYGENGHVKPSIEIDVKNRLRNFLYSRSLEDELEKKPDTVINLIKSAVRDICRMYDVDIRDFNVRFVNLPKRMLIKNLNHMFINKFVSVEGIVRKVYEPKPVLKYAVFECPSCGKDYHVEVDGGFVQRPFKCERCGERNLILNVDRSELTDIQKIQIQDLPENLESSEPPKLLDVYLYDDLAGKVLPGDKVIINGILRIKGGKKFKAELDVYLEANSIEFIDQDVRNIQITEKDKEEIRKLAKRKDIYDLLVQSIAPSIKGYDVIKEAIVLQLFGGITRINPDGTKQRGDIHILLVGDPATSKSQILRAVKQVAPRAILATGYASTGAGLCVAPDSIVFTDSCALEIEKFVEENMKSSVKYNEIAEYSEVKGVSVLTLNDAKISEKAVEKVWRLKSPVKLVRITTQTGKELIVTPETKVMVLEDGKVSWKPAKDLTKQDYVATVRRLKHRGKVVTTLELLSDLDNLIIYGVKGIVKKLVDVATSKLGISKKELSKMIGTYENSLIHNWVKDNARGNIKMKHLRKLVEITGVSWVDVAKEVSEVSLRAGRRIKIPIYVDERLAYLAGLIAGDGCIVGNFDRFVIRFTNSCDELRRRFKELLRDIFGIEAKDVARKNKVPTVEFSSKIVAHLLRKLGIPPSPKSSKLDMTPILLSLPNEILAGFIRGLFDCDGCVVIRRKGSSIVELDTTSKNLAKKLQLALLRFGIVAHLRKRDVKGKTNVINGKDVVSRHDRYSLIIYGENIEKFAKYIGFENPEKNRKLQKLLELRRYKKSNPNLDVIPGVGKVIDEIIKKYGINIRGFNSKRKNVSRYKLREIVEILKNSCNGDERIRLLEFLANSDVLWEKIKNLEIINSPFDFVYDLTVENTHSFIANGIVVHNTVTAVKADDGRWTLEAGALVLADRGIALIDEVEKMDKKDRRYMLESLEQQSYHKDTEILLADGRKVRIGEFVDSLIESNRDKVIVGKDTEILPVDDVFVLGYDLNTKKIVITKADRVSRHIAPKKFVRITFSNGRSVTVTPEHPVLVWKDGNIVEVPAEKVKEGCLVPAIRWYETLTKNVISKDLAKLLGYILSDGYTYDKVYEVGFTNTCKNYVEEFKRIAGKLNLKFKETKNYTNCKLPLSIVRINSKNFYNRLRNLCPEIFAKAKEKRIPYVVMGGSKDIKEAFINGFFKGDGFVDKYRVGLTTTSKAMAEDLHDLLLSIGINSYIYEWKGCYKVVISGYDSILKFSEIVKDDPRYCRILQILERSKNRRNDRDILPKEITEILRDVLNALRLNDGYLTNNISRNFNAHRKTLKDRLKIVEEVIKAVEDGLNSENINKKIESAKRVVRLTEVAKKLGVKYSTLRYRLKKDPTPLLEFAKERLEDLKRKVEIVKGYIEGNIRFLKVRKVEIIENRDSKWVYDITVEPYHLFVSHGLILHNTITVAKAGINATLNTRCSILACANPKRGRFDKHEPIVDQIDLDPPLLSRFDLIFVVLDEPDEVRDKEIAKTILTSDTESKKPKIDPELFKKYILFARNEIKDIVLTPEAEQKIIDYYIDLRMRSKEQGAIAITARQLEALRRLTEASAKIRLSNVATVEDAERAIRIFEESIKQIAIDPETGKLDIDYAISGVSAVQRDRIAIIKNIVKELESSTPWGAPEEEILERAENSKVPKDKAIEVLEKLKQKGELYCPRYGYYKIAGYE